MILLFSLDADTFLGLALGAVVNINILHTQSYHESHQILRTFSRHQILTLFSTKMVEVVAKVVVLLQTLPQT